MNADTKREVEKFAEGLGEAVMRRINWAACHGRFTHTFFLYLAYGIEPGSFIKACLENDLTEAYARADSTSTLQIPDIVQWMYDEVPVSARGNSERVETWQNDRSEDPLVPREDANRWADALLDGRCPDEV